MSSFEHIIWDWNGTLLNDAHLCIDVMNVMLRSRGLSEIDKTLYQEIFDFPISNYYQALGFDFDTEPFVALAKEYCDEYDSRVQECDLHAGALSVLAEISKAGATQSILSAHEHLALESVLKHYKITDYFSGVYGLNDQYAASKIERGQELIKSLGINPSRTVLVGDTIHDFEVASALGVSCMLISHGHHSKRRLAAVHESVIDSLDFIMAPNQALNSQVSPAGTPHCGAR